MKIIKLIIILVFLVIVNFIGVYLLFYYQPIYKFMKIGNESNLPVAISEQGDKIAFFRSADNGDIIRIYNFTSDKIRDLNLKNFGRLSYSDIISFSPNGRRLSYFVRPRPDKKTIAIYDLDKQENYLLEDKLSNKDLAYADNSRSVKAMAWLDNNTLIYENIKHPERNGIIIVNLRTGEQEKYIERGARPSLSPRGRYLAYFKRDENGEEFDVLVKDLKTDNEIIITKDIKDYPESITWSPSGERIAISYSVLRQKIRQDRLAVADKAGNFYTISETKFLAVPRWINDHTLFMVESRAGLPMIPSTSVAGLYSYDLKTKKYKKITGQVRSKEYTVSPKGNLLLSSTQKNKMFVLDISRLFKPLSLDKLRNFFGIINL